MKFHIRMQKQHKRPLQIAYTITTMYITLKQLALHMHKKLHSIDWEHNWELLIACPDKPLCLNKIRTTTTKLCLNKIRTTTTKGFLISNTVVLNFSSHSATFAPQFFAPLSWVPGPFNRSVSVWYSSDLWHSNR